MVWRVEHVYHPNDEIPGIAVDSPDCPVISPTDPVTPLPHIVLRATQRPESIPSQTPSLLFLSPHRFFSYVCMATALKITADCSCPEPDNGDCGSWLMSIAQEGCVGIICRPLIFFFPGEKFLPFACLIGIIGIVWRVEHVYHRYPSRDHSLAVDAQLPCDLTHRPRHSIAPHRSTRHTQSRFFLPATLTIRLR